MAEKNTWHPFEGGEGYETPCTRCGTPFSLHHWGSGIADQPPIDKWFAGLERSDNGYPICGKCRMALPPDTTFMSHHLGECVEPQGEQFTSSWIVGGDGDGNSLVEPSVVREGLPGYGVDYPPPASLADQYNAHHRRVFGTDAPPMTIPFTADKSATSLSLLVVEMSDCIIVKIEQGDAPDYVTKYSMKAEGVYVFDRSMTFERVKRGVEGEKPVPRIERYDSGYYLFANGANWSVIDPDSLDALSQLAGAPLPVFDPDKQGGTWTQLVPDYTGLDMTLTANIYAKTVNEASLPFKAYRYTRSRDDGVGR